MDFLEAMNWLKGGICRIVIDSEDVQYNINKQGELHTMTENGWKECNSNYSYLAIEEFQEYHEPEEEIEQPKFFVKYKKKPQCLMDDIHGTDIYASIISQNGKGNDAKYFIDGEYCLIQDFWNTWGEDE